MDSPPASLIQRFAGDCRALTGEGPLRLGVAVSGGPDSLALLLLAAAAFPGKVAAATVDHGLRDESAAEAEFVARCCADLGVPHAALPVEVADGNLQHRAREARYAALAEWAAVAGVTHLVTAHHADDQAETLLMRLNRASGVGGLAGIRAHTRIAAIEVIRPLLGWRRSEFAEIVSGQGWRAVDDPSNRDPAFDRVRMRRALAESEWIDPVALSHSAANLADAEAALAWASDRAFETCVEQEGERLAMPPDLPRELALRVIGRIISQLGEGEPRGSEIARLHDALGRGEVATLAGVVARPGKAVWRFAAAPPRR